MKETLELVLLWLTAVIIALQIVALLYLMISQHNKTKEEKKFWRDASKQSNELYNDLKAMREACSNNNDDNNKPE